MRRDMIVKYDYQATAPNQHSLVKGEGVIKIGKSPYENYGWARVMREVDGQLVVKLAPLNCLTFPENPVMGS